MGISICIHHPHKNKHYIYYIVFAEVFMPVYREYTSCCISPQGSVVSWSRREPGVPLGIY